MKLPLVSHSGPFPICSDCDSTDRAGFEGPSEEEAARAWHFLRTGGWLEKESEGVARSGFMKKMVLRYFLLDQDGRTLKWFHPNERQNRVYEIAKKQCAEKHDKTQKCSLWDTYQFTRVLPSEDTHVGGRNKGDALALDGAIAKAAAADEKVGPNYVDPNYDYPLEFLLQARKLRYSPFGLSSDLNEETKEFHLVAPMVAPLVDPGSTAEGSGASEVVQPDAVMQSWINALETYIMYCFRRTDVSMRPEEKEAWFGKKCNGDRGEQWRLASELGLGLTKIEGGLEANDAISTAGDASWLGSSDAQDRRDFLQKLTRLGIASPRGEGDFHAARIYRDDLNKSVYDVEQWKDYLDLKHGSEELQ
jgi:hypothetical protein